MTAWSNGFYLCLTTNQFEYNSQPIILYPDNLFLATRVLELGGTTSGIETATLSGGFTEDVLTGTSQAQSLLLLKTHPTLSVT